MSSIDALWGIVAMQDRLHENKEKCDAQVREFKEVQWEVAHEGADVAKKRVVRKTAVKRARVAKK